MVNFGFYPSIGHSNKVSFPLVMSLLLMQSSQNVCPQVGRSFGITVVEL